MNINSIASLCCQPAQVRLQQFVETLRKKGECWVNYVLGASYHYELIDGGVYLDNTHSYVFCGLLDGEIYVELDGVSSITTEKYVNRVKENTV